MALYVTFWFDVEDYISPRADDALLLLIDAFEKRGLMATWKLVGEKLRALERRGRRDIIDKLSKQDLGYHTDYHSMHPTVAEYCEGLDWAEGQREFELREGPGLKDMERVFGRTPSTYGQPGGGWVPHAYPVLRKWGIPTYVDEAYHIGLDHQPFWYCGILNVLKLIPNTHRVDILGGEGEIGKALARFAKAKAELESEGGGLLQVYYHPCEFSCDDFWDGANFAHGANPSREEWILPAQNTDEEMLRRVSVFEGFLDGIISTGVGVVTTADLPTLFYDRAYQTTLGTADILRISKALGGGELSPITFDGFTLSPAEGFRALMDYLTHGEPVSVGPLLGPTVRITSDTVFPGTDSESFTDTCKQVCAAMDETGHIPSSIFVGSNRLSPGDFLATASGFVTDLLEGGGSPEYVNFRQGQVTLEDNVTGEDAWGWIIFPRGFDAPRIIEQGKLQTWTMKPAILS